MMQEMEQTHAEKVAMYGNIEKAKLIEMLVEANNTIVALSTMKAVINIAHCQHSYTQISAHWSSCSNCGMIKPIGQ